LGTAKAGYEMAIALRDGFVAMKLPILLVIIKGFNDNLFQNFTDRGESHPLRIRMDNIFMD
jgi:hypothetical protein